MADEIVQTPAPVDGDPGRFGDLDSALRSQFESAGAKVDSSPDFDPEPKTSVQKSPEPSTKEEIKEDDASSNDNEPDPSKSKELPKPKGVIPPTAKPKAEAISPSEEKLTDPEKIKPPQNLSKSGMEGWTALKESAKKAHSIVEKQKVEITKLNSIIAEKSTATATELEAMKKELDDHRGFRATADYQYDPEFKKQFSEPMGKLEAEMRKMLTDAGVREDVINDQKWDDASAMDRVVKSLEEHVNSITADRFKMRAKEFIELSFKKGEFLNEFKGKHKEFEAKRAKEFEQKSVEGESLKLKAVNDETLSKDDKGQYRFPFLLKFEADASATPEQIKEIEAHNAKADVLRDRLEKMIAIKTPEDQARLAIAAVAASWLKEKNQELRDQVSSLKEELAKYNNITSERRGPEAKGGGGKKVASLDLDDHLREAFGRDH